MAGALDMFKLDGKVAVVTGGSKGIGAFYSQALAEAGANVVVADVDPKTLAETTTRLSNEHEGHVLGCELDVLSRDSIKAMLQKIDQRWGRMDILVNNAAYFAAIPRRQSGLEIPDDEFDRVMAINVRGVYACITESLPLMKRNPGARIVNIASSVAFKGSNLTMHYGASKAAVMNLTWSMAPVLGEMGIAINSLAPGGTASDSVVAARGPVGEGQFARRALKRIEVPQDLVGTMLFLASPASEFMTGQTLVVDGGDYLH